MTSQVYEVPPPALGITLTLDCGETASTSETTLTATPNPAVIGQPVALVATVTGSGSAPTGTVAFTAADGSVTDCAAQPLAVGQATCVVTFPHVPSGPLTLTAAYSGDADHPASASHTELTIDRATPAITWATPTAISYPTALEPTQLNATTSVAGTFTYTVDGTSPAQGAVLHAGTHLLTAAFTPTDTTDYTTATAQVPITVLPGAQAITIDALPPVTTAMAAITVTAHGGPSGQPVTLRTTSAGTCTIGASSGTGADTVTTVNIVAAGTCSLIASQAGTIDWAPAAEAAISFTISPATTSAILDARVSADQRVAADRITSPPLTTSGPDELILAFISADGPPSASQRATSVAGGNLTWILVARSNATYGTAEIWQAHAPSRLDAVRISARLAKSGYDGSITIAAFTGARGHVGTSVAAAGTNGAPTLHLTSTASGSVIWAAGHNWSRARTVTTPPDQQVVHQFVDIRVNDTYWTQDTVATTAPTAPLTIHTLTPNTGRWQLVAVEIPPAAVAGTRQTAVTIPAY